MICSTQIPTSITVFCPDDPQKRQNNRVVCMVFIRCNLFFQFFYRGSPTKDAIKCMYYLHTRHQTCFNFALLSLWKMAHHFQIRLGLLRSGQVKLSQVRFTQVRLWLGQVNLSQVRFMYFKKVHLECLQKKSCLNVCTQYIKNAELYQQYTQKYIR